VTALHKINDNDHDDDDDDDNGGGEHTMETQSPRYISFKNRF